MLSFIGVRAARRAVQDRPAVLNTEFETVTAFVPETCGNPCNYFDKDSEKSCRTKRGSDGKVLNIYCTERELDKDRRSHLPRPSYYYLFSLSYCIMFNLTYQVP